MNKDQEREFNLRRNAVRQGFEFVELRLKETYHHDTLTPIKVTGVLELHGKPLGVKQGKMQYQMHMKPGVLRFEFNEERACFVAFMVIDKEKGHFSPKSYNLDLLASHSFKNNIFYIHDNPKVEKEVEKRAKILKIKMVERDAKRIAEQAKLDAERDLEIKENREERMKALQKEIDKLRLEEEMSGPKKQKVTA